MKGDFTRKDYLPFRVQSLLFPVTSDHTDMKGSPTKKLLFIAIAWTTLVVVSCHDKDPAPAPCKPHSLLYDTDSIVYSYTQGRITKVLYYASGNQNYEDDIEYNAAGLPSTIGKFMIAIDGERSVDAYNTLTYDDNGLPASLVTDSYSSRYTTTFTHNSAGQLIEAKTRSGFQMDFVGNTRYEYDDNGNVPRVYYTVNVNGNIQEVLARENLAFDDKEKFYSNSRELTIMNVYVYGYLPNKNNCLGSTVHYYSYVQHFTSPLSINFAATYNDNGYIQSLQSDTPNTRLYSGEVLFKNIVYDCR